MAPKNKRNYLVPRAVAVAFLLTLTVFALASCTNMVSGLLHKHEWSEWRMTKQPSCAEEGTEIRECECGETESRPVEKIEHFWGGWYTDVYANCQEEGVEKRICYNCSAEETQSIALTDHNWGYWYTEKESTCTEEGIRKHTCYYCEAEETETIEMVDHRKGEWTVTTEPADNVTGIESLLCRNCSAVIETREMEISLEGFYLADAKGYYLNGFSQGTTSYYYTSSKTPLLNKFGRPVYTLLEADGKNEIILAYGNGYFISQLGDVQYLKKADGTVVFSTESLGISFFGMVGKNRYIYTNHTAFLADGYVLACKLVESFSDAHFEVGILNLEGEYIVPMSKDNALIAGIKNVDRNTLETGFDYLGAGMLSPQYRYISYNYSNDYMYSIKDNTSYTITAPDSLPDYGVTWIWSDLLNTVQFKNGNVNFYYDKTSYNLSANGTVTARSQLVTDDTSRYTLDVYFYADTAEEKNDYAFYYDRNKEYYILTKNGTVVKEFSDINITNAIFTEHGILAFIKNPQGSFYYTIIGNDGAYLFDPIKTDIAVIYTETGYCLKRSGGYYSSETIVIDAAGKAIFEGKNVNGIYNGIISTNYSDFAYLTEK